MAIRFGDKLILAKIESTYATDPSPAATDAVRTMDLTRQRYEGGTVERVVDRSSMGAYSTINPAPFVTLTFSVEFSGLGAAASSTVSPAYSDLLRACGLQRSDEAALVDGGTWTTGTSYTVGQRVKVSNINYTCILAHTAATANKPPTGASYATYWEVEANRPAAVLYQPRDTGFESVTIHYYEGTNRQVILGCRGSAEIMMERGQIPKINFSFTGFYATPSVQTAITGNISDYVVPYPMTDANTPDFTLGTLSSLKLSSLSVNMNNQVVYRDLVNSKTVEITDRKASFNMSVEADTQTNFNLPSFYESQSGTVPLSVMKLTHVPASANRQIQITTDGLQVNAISDTNSDELLEYGLSGPITPEGTNADELTLRYF